MITYWHSSAFRKAAEISPVYAPEACAETSWPPYLIGKRSAATSVWTDRRSVNGGNTATSTWVKSCLASFRLQASFCTNAIDCRWSRFIFQLPAIKGTRPPPVVVMLANREPPVQGGACPRGTRGWHLR